MHNKEYMKVKNHFLITSIIIAFFAVAPSAFAATIERVSLSNAGVQGNNFSNGTSISGDGRYVGFHSQASNLVLGDMNNDIDIFVYDRTTNTIERVSVDSLGNEANNISLDQEISTDGEYVAFSSLASNLVPNDTNSASDVFVYNRILDITERVSVNNLEAEGNENSSNASISTNGRFVAFMSTATNLVPNDTNNKSDIFVYDRAADNIERVSVDNAGVQGNEISHNLEISDSGRYVTFTSDADNLVPDDTNATADIFVYDRTTETIQRVSVNGVGIEGNASSFSPSISADGRYITYHSWATNLHPADTTAWADVFVFDRLTSAVELVSVSSAGVQSNFESFNASISANGRYVSYGSNASNLVPGVINGESDIYVFDRTTDTIKRLSVNSMGVEGNQLSDSNSISADGRFTAFMSYASNLVAGDTNAQADVFVRDLPNLIQLQPAKPVMFSTTTNNDTGISGERAVVSEKSDIKEVPVSEKTQ